MTTTTKPTITLPAGVYAIADPCYLLTDSDWMELDVLHRANPDQQSFTLASGSRPVLFDTGGDGWFFDQESFSYGIDSGQIAIRSTVDVPADGLALLDDGSRDSGPPPIGSIHRFDRPFDLSVAPVPVFRIGPFTITAITP